MTTHKIGREFVARVSRYNDAFDTFVLEKIEMVGGQQRYYFNIVLKSTVIALAESFKVYTTDANAFKQEVEENTLRIPFTLSKEQVDKYLIQVIRTFPVSEESRRFYVKEGE